MIEHQNVVIDLDATGFSSIEIDTILPDPGDEEVATKPLDDVPEVAAIGQPTGRSLAAG